MEEFGDFVAKKLLGITDMSLLILKGHVIVEYTLNCYLESISKSSSPDFFKENFSFANKTKIAKHFGNLGSLEQTLNEELVLLNKLRNSIAHTLDYNEKHLEELFVALGKKNPTGDFLDTKLNVEVKFKDAIGFITGVVFGEYKYHTDREDFEQFVKEDP